MLKRGFLTATVVAFAIVSTASASDQLEKRQPKCKPKDVAGTYLRVTYQSDLYGNGSNVERTYAYQLVLHEDGTAYQYWTGFPDLMIELGSGSPYVGSWACRDDDKVVVTLLLAGYGPITVNPGTGDPTADIAISYHARVTYLFEVQDSDTLTRVQARARIYDMSEDPSIPTAGTLGTESFDQIDYTRLVASDADLTP